MNCLKKLAGAGFLFTVIAGSLNHFVYAWSGNSKVVAVFSPINESPWEHLKLLTTPMLLFALLEYAVQGKQVANFVPVRVASIWLGMFVILAGFYTYSGIIGNNFLWADILLFVFAAAVAYLFGTKHFGMGRWAGRRAQSLGWAGLALLLFCVWYFTFSPPPLAVFAAP